MTDIDYAEVPTVPIEVKCKCAEYPRRIPLRMTLDGLKIFHFVLRKIPMKPSLVLQTWRCGKCKEIIPITVQQLHLVLAKSENE